MPGRSEQKDLETLLQTEIPQYCSLKNVVTHKNTVGEKLRPSDKSPLLTSKRFLWRYSNVQTNDCKLFPEVPLHVQKFNKTGRMLHLEAVTSVFR